MAQDIFIDPSTQRKLDEDGYVVIQLLSADELKELKNVFLKYFGGEDLQHFTSTNIIRSKEWRKNVANDIRSVIDAPLAKYMINTKFWLPAFLIKPVGEDTEFEIHQDWTFVDEDRFTSGNVWMPLDDTNAENGTLHFIPKSHYKYFKSLRAQTIPKFYQGNEALMKKLTQSLDVKAGQAVIFHHSIVHFTPPNRSKDLRIAVSCGFNSADAPLKFYYRASDSVVEEYMMPDNFVFEYEGVSDLDLRPALGTLNRKIEMTQKIYSPEELTRLFGH